jgi:phage terminase large subunit-like protein
LLRVFHPDELTSFEISDLRIKLANGSVIRGYSADRPDRLRNARLAGAWVDELAAMVRVDEVWRILGDAVGESGQVFVATTPRPIRLLRKLARVDDGSVVFRTGSTWDNAPNLSPQTLVRLRELYGGSRLGAQELDGVLFDDDDGVGAVG